MTTWLCNSMIIIMFSLFTVREWFLVGAKNDVIYAGGTARMN
jgi:hypothetical protein